nr:hypothetical protein [Tanacetum cinerariifolium]
MVAWKVMCLPKEQGGLGSIVNRLILAATVYFIWQERNRRVKLMSFKVKKTSFVLKVADIWKLRWEEMYLKATADYDNQLKDMIMILFLNGDLMCCVSMLLNVVPNVIRSFTIYLLMLPIRASKVHYVELRYGVCRGKCSKHTFFTSRDVKAMEELTWMYENTLQVIQTVRFERPASVEEMLKELQSDLKYGLPTLICS